MSPLPAAQAQNPAGPVFDCCQSGEGLPRCATPRRALVPRIPRAGITFGIEGLYTPLSCISNGGYIAKLQMACIIPVVLAAVIVLFAGLYLRYHRALSAANTIELAAPLALRMLFVAYPFVTTIAFEAWVCNDFEEGSWLTEDVNIVCGSPEHQQAINIALVAVIVCTWAKLKLLHARSCLL